MTETSSHEVISETYKLMPGKSKLAESAIKSFNAGDYEDAIRYFKELSVENKDALAGVGISYYRSGSFYKAIDYLTEAVKYSGGRFLARKFLAFAYYETDDLEKSLFNAEKALLIKDEPELRDLSEKLKKANDIQAGFIEDNTLHFKVIFDGNEHYGVSRTVVSILEDAYRLIGQELDYFPERPVTVILYSEKDFYKTAEMPEWSGGLYDGKIRVPVRGVKGREALLRQVLFHEYTHAVIHFITHKCPAWINEGLAVYFSKKAPEKIGQVIPLTDLEDSFIGIGNKSITIAYLESFSAVSYLIERYGIYRMKEFLLSLSEGDNLNQAFSNAFSITYDEFVSSWGRGGNSS